jgi:YbbR domain-containing protein
MNNTQKLDISILVMAFFIALLLFATSCNSYGNKCLSPGALNGAGKTKFNK